MKLELSTFMVTRFGIDIDAIGRDSRKNRGDCRTQRAMK